jgi:hypothetical protein
MHVNTNTSLVKAIKEAKLYYFRDQLTTYFRYRMDERMPQNQKAIINWTILLYVDIDETVQLTNQSSTETAEDVK